MRLEELEGYLRRNTSVEVKYLPAQPDGQSPAEEFHLAVTLQHRDPGRAEAVPLVDVSVGLFARPEGDPFELWAPGPGNGAYFRPWLWRPSHPRAWLRRASTEGQWLRGLYVSWTPGPERAGAWSPRRGHYLLPGQSWSFPVRCRFTGLDAASVQANLALTTCVCATPELMGDGQGVPVSNGPDGYQVLRVSEGASLRW